MGSGFRIWKDAVAAGKAVAPRSGRGVRGFRGALAGALLVGAPRPAPGAPPGDGWRGVTLVRVEADGSGATLATAWVPTPEAARALEARLRFRAGPAGGRLMGWDGEAAFTVQAIVDGMALRQLRDGPDVDAAVLAYALGGTLGLAGLPARPAAEAVVDCPEGGAWRRVASLEGAQGIARALPEAAARYAWDRVCCEGGEPALYVLDMPGADGPVAWVRVPGPEADPFELPEIAGAGGTDPYPGHAGRIAALGLAVDAMLGPRHCRPAARPASSGRRI